MLEQAVYFRCIRDLLHRSTDLEVCQHLCIDADLLESISMGLEVDVTISTITAVAAHDGSSYQYNGWMCIAEELCLKKH